MPGIYYQPVDRRRFLKQISVGAALVVVGLSTKAEDPAAAEKPFHLAVLSDTHIPADAKYENRKFLPWQNLETVVTQVREARPDAVIHCGDMARLTGEVEDYQAIKNLLAPLAEQSPVFLGLGNHDNRANFLKSLNQDSPEDQGVTDKHVLLVDRPAVRLILLDSLLHTNVTPGFLGKGQRNWLDGFLKKSDDKPTVLFVHHTLGDADGDLLDVDRLFSLLQLHPKVKAIFFGHSHEYSITKRQALHLINIPAVGYNFRDTEPVGWMDAVFTTTGVKLVLKAIGGSRERDGETTNLTWST